jgi:hypothetical protein
MLHSLGNPDRDFSASQIDTDLIEKLFASPPLSLFRPALRRSDGAKANRRDNKSRRDSPVEASSTTTFKPSPPKFEYLAR